MLGDAVTGERAAQLLQHAAGSPRRAVNAFFDLSKGGSASVSFAKVSLVLSVLCFHLLSSTCGWVCGP